MSRSNELTGPAAVAEIKRLTRRNFAIGLAAAAAGGGGWAYLKHYGPQDDKIPWFLRRVLRTNEAISRAAFADRLAPEFPVARAAEPRVNGRYGLLEMTDAATWRVRVTDERGAERELSVADVFAGLPRVEMVTEFKCVEGWSEIVQWGGVRFADFAAKFGPPAGRYEYVGLMSPAKPPDGRYYVGLDTASALHPQTLLCDSMNGGPLTPEHGGPLRLVIPVKYGVKNIKQVNEIAFTNRRPADFWAERGYDWYLGL
ncbi:MAG: molybdopterin-dependent oxidoreductase [Gemmataceae bacterium]